MSRLIKAVIWLLPIFILNGCNSCSGMFMGGSEGPGCDVAVVGGMILVAPVAAPVVIAQNTKSNLAMKKRWNQTYQESSKKIAENDYEVIKKCTLGGCIGHVPNKKSPTLKEMASKKLLGTPRACLKSEDYPVYMAAYLNLIDSQRKTKQAVDEQLISQTWTFYQSTEKIAYDSQNLECAKPTEQAITLSVQAKIEEKSGLRDRLIDLKAASFNQSIKSINSEKADQHFRQCIQLIPENHYKYSHSPSQLYPFSYHTSLYYAHKICDSAYQQYILTGQKLPASLSDYRKAWATDIDRLYDPHRQKPTTAN